MLYHKNLVNSFCGQFSFGKIDTCIMYQYVNRDIDLLKFLCATMYIFQIAQVSNDILTADAKFLFDLLFQDRTLFLVPINAQAAWLHERQIFWLSGTLFLMWHH